MYVAVKGGEKAIDAALDLLARRRRGDDAVPELSVDQIDAQLSLAVDRVMTEGSLYDRQLGALAVKQARGDLVEAAFLLRAYRTTLPRFGFSEPLDTARMALGWRACRDDIALGLQTCCANYLDCLRHNRDAGKIIRHTPAMDATISDIAREGIMPPGFGILERFTIRMAKENQARPAARP